MSCFEFPIDDAHRGQSDKRQPEHSADGVFPAGSALRSLRSHQLDRITVSNVNRNLFISVLNELAPELAEACGEYLFDTLFRGEALCPHTVMSSYFGSSPYRVEHTILLEVGEGRVNECHQHISVEKPGMSEQQPIVTLSRRHGQIELELDLSSKELKGAWGWAERIGEAIGINALPTRFIQAPVELEYFEDEGVRVSLSEDVVVRTTLGEAGSGGYSFQRVSKDREAKKSVWFPCSLYVKDAERDDMRAVLPLLDSERGQAIVESGFFELGERFVAKEAPELSRADMRALAKSLAFKVHMEVYRSVLLGYVDALLAGDQDGDSLAPFTQDSHDGESFVSWASEESSDYLPGESSSDSELSDGDFSEDTEWSPDDEDRSYFSSITLRGFSTSKENRSIGLTSRLAAEGDCSSSETPSEARRYERDGLFMSVEFEGCAGDVHPNDAVKRFALVREIAKKLGLFNFPARGRFLADLDDSRRQALLEGMIEEGYFGVDYLVGRVMVHAKRFPWPGT